MRSIRPVDADNNTYLALEKTGQSSVCRQVITQWCFTELFSRFISRQAVKIATRSSDKDAPREWHVEASTIETNIAQDAPTGMMRISSSHIADAYLAPTMEIGARRLIGLRNIYDNDLQLSSTQVGW